MKAKLTLKDVSNAHNYSNDKEQIDRLLLQVVTKDGIQELVDARFWMGRSASASVVYCSVWIHDRKSNLYISGKGNAGGWGYHKESSALGAALSSAGVELYGSPYLAPGEKRRVNHGDGPEDFKQRAHIGGCGTGSMEAALMAIGVALGYKIEKLHLVR